jgi:hypothetical protein
VFAYLRQRILIGTQLFALSAEPVPVYAGISIELQNGADSVATVQSVQQALAAYLWALPPGGPDGGGWPLGRTVMPDELLTQAARVPGVRAVVPPTTLYMQSGSSWVPVPSVPLQVWQVPALQDVSVATDGSAPPLPADGAGGGGSSGPSLVPVVPKCC